MDKKVLEDAKEIGEITKERYYLYPSLSYELKEERAKALEAKTRKIFNKNKGKFKQNEIYIKGGRYGEQPAYDSLIALIKKRGACKDAKGRAFEWYVVSVENEMFSGADLWFNYILKERVAQRHGGYRIKYLSTDKEVVMIEDNIKAYFAEIFDNWNDYKKEIENDEIPSPLNDDRQVKRLKAAALSYLVEEAGVFHEKKEDQREYFIENASKAYIKSFIEKQERHNIKSPFIWKHHMVMNSSLEHLLDASPNMIHLVISDIFERGCSKTMRKAQEKGLQYLAGMLHDEICQYRGMNLDDPKADVIIKDYVKGMLKKFKGKWKTSDKK